MKSVKKRDNRVVEFDRSKIVSAIQRAFIEVDGSLSDSSTKIANTIADEIAAIPDDKSVEEIQDLVIYDLMDTDRKDVAKAYTEYRFKRSLIRNSHNTTDNAIMELLNHTNEEVNEENSNKDPEIVSVQRDYIAGITSKDVTRRILLPKEVVDAHDAGIIHFHDADYYAQSVLTNCSLCNLDDMLQNGTVINGTKIDKPHRFITAATISTQIITAVTSSQYGGISITLTHLAPFVRDSYNIYLKKYLSWGFDERKAAKFAELDTRKEVEDGCQTFIYQVNSMSTTNGQAPFLTVFMYIDETEEYRDELVMIIEEFLRQRIQGMKNEQGIWITPAFPKLIYVLDADNIYPGTKYWSTTVLAAQCTAKRMVPDYISAKVMKQLKGYVYPAMGCIVGNEVVTYKFCNTTYIEGIGRMWWRLLPFFKAKLQPGREDDWYMDLSGVEIYDHVNGWTNCRRIIRNTKCDILRMKFSGGRCLDCTPNHPFETENRGVVFAKDLTEQDEIRVDYESNICEENMDYDPDLAWLDGMLICDSSYIGTIAVSLAAEGEDDLAQAVQDNLKKFYGITTKVKLQSRERRGTYKDIIGVSTGDGLALPKFSDIMISKFGGIIKMNRHLPNEIFQAKREARLGMLAGIIDADGYVNDTNGRTVSVCTIGSVNKELAIQQMMLIQSLGIPTTMYQNHYKGKGRFDTIRYQVSFVPTEEVISYLKSEKKRNHYIAGGDLSYRWKQNATCHITESHLLDWKEDTYDVTTDTEHFTVSGIYSHNCRSFLTPYVDPVTQHPKFYGRFNCGVVTISLPDLAFSSGGDYDKFWQLFEERTELCHKALRCRIDRIKDTSVNVAPILWRHGAFARLPMDAKIGDIMFNGYSTISLGYAGLYECVKYMTGHSHMDKGVGREFGLKVMQALNDKCTKWKNEEHIDYSLYGTPIENTTYKFAKCLKKRFGDDIFVKMDGKDRNYITNSYHTAVFEKINPFEKLIQEAEFQKLSPGGAISYIECSDLTHNIPAVLEVMQCIYENIMYAELNIKSDYCACCGYDGEIKVVDDGGKLVWECPNCGNRDQHKMSVARRTCGYVGTHFWSQGRTDEIRNRYVHLTDIPADGEEVEEKE